MTVIDAGVMIGFLNAADVHHDAAEAALSEAFSRGDTVVLPVSAFAECLVGPIRRGEEALSAVRDLIARLQIQLVAIDESIAEAAARLRAGHRSSLRLADALVIATANWLRADHLVTTDHRWPDARALGLSAQIHEL